MRPYLVHEGYSVVSLRLSDEIRPASPVTRFSWTHHRVIMHRRRPHLQELEPKPRGAQGPRLQTKMVVSVHLSYLVEKKESLRKRQCTAMGYGYGFYINVLCIELYTSTCNGPEPGIEGPARRLSPTRTSSGPGNKQHGPGSAQRGPKLNTTTTTTTTSRRRVIQSRYPEGPGTLQPGGFTYNGCSLVLVPPGPGSGPRSPRTWPHHNSHGLGKGGSPCTLYETM